MSWVRFSAQAQVSCKDFTQKGFVLNPNRPSVRKSQQLSDIGLIGLAVMGQNLALNIADHGFRISVFNRTTEKTDKFVADNPNTPGGVVGTSDAARNSCARSPSRARS